MVKTVISSLICSFLVCTSVFGGDVANLTGRYSTEFLEELTPAGVRREPLHCGTWESGVKWHAIHFDQVLYTEFHASMATTPQRLHVFARLDNHFGDAFSDDSDAMWSIRVLDYDNDAIGWAYLEKDSPLGDLVFERLKHSSYHKMVADFSYLPNADSPQYFVINNVRAIDTWLTVD